MLDWYRLAGLTLEKTACYSSVLRCFIHLVPFLTECLKIGMDKKTVMGSIRFVLCLWPVWFEGQKTPANPDRSEKLHEPIYECVCHWRVDNDIVGWNERRRVSGYSFLA